MMEEKRLAKAASILGDGGVLLHPTSTVYGLACIPTLQDACRKIRSIKGNDKNKPLLLITDEFERISGWFDLRSELETRLIEIQEDSLNLTILLNASKNCPSGPLGNSRMIGIRRTKHDLSRELITILKSPLVSTSANKEGQDSTSLYSQISPYIIDSVDFAISDDRLMTGISSTLVRVENEKIRVLRTDTRSSNRISDIFGKEFIDQM